MSYSDEAIAAAKAKFSIVSLISEDGFSLKKKGSTHVGCCPFHAEKTGSFNVYPDGSYYCFGCAASGDVADWFANQRGIAFKDFMALAGQSEDAYTPIKKAPSIDPRNYIYEDPESDEADDDFPAPSTDSKSVPWAPPSSFSWSAYVDRVTPEKLAELSEWRGYNQKFCESLHLDGFIGLDERGNWAIPVQDAEDNIIKAHIRTDKGWTYFPKNLPNSPLVIGDPKSAKYTIIAESQWDLFALMAMVGNYHDGAWVATRGASNTGNVEKITEGCNNVIALTQNDPETKRNKKTSLTPAESWLKEISDSFPDAARFKVAETPKDHKDLNDWIKDAKPSRRTVEELVFIKSKSPGSWDTLSLQGLLKHKPNPEHNLLGVNRRFLCRGGSLLLIGQSGIGKSTLSMQWIIHMSLGLPFFGITTAKPLKVMVVQAENDEGDLAEMAAGSIQGMREYLSADGINIEAGFKNIKFVREMETCGGAFLSKLDRNLAISKPDIVFIDPILSFVGDDISKQSVVAEFFRNGLNSIIHRHNCAVVIIHHTGKPPKEVKKDMTIHDYAYSGLGSSDLTNWARAVAVFTATPHDDHYKLMLAKRGSRAEMTCPDGETTNEIWLKHSRHGMSWEQTLDPTDQEKDKLSKEDKTRFAIKNEIEISWPAPPVDHDSLLNKICAKQYVSKVAAKRKIGKYIETGMITRDNTTGIYIKNY